MKTEKKPRIAVIYGGKSCEHEISIITACLAKGYFNGEVIGVYIDKQNRAFLVGNWTPKQHLSGQLKTQVVFLTGRQALGIVKGGKLVHLPVDVAVNCCHGINGEDGCIAGLCRMCGIPLIGSDVAASAIAMDKILTKRLLQSFDFPVVDGVAMSRGDDIAVAEALHYPVIVKPALLGSSIGVTVAHNARELNSALKRAFTFCSEALVEHALTDFTELNCAALRHNGQVQTSNIDVPVTANELLTFNDKYIKSSANKVPSGISESISTQVSRLTSDIYSKLHFGGVIRVDFLLDNNTGKLYVNEINTTPGSLAYGLWEGVFSRTQYGEALVNQAIADYRELQAFTYTFSSGVLTAPGGGKKK